MGSERLAMTVEEAGEALGISRGLAYRLARQGDLPVVRLGRRLVVPVWQLRALLGEETGRSGTGFCLTGQRCDACHVFHVACWWCWCFAAWPAWVSRVVVAWVPRGAERALLVGLSC
jgi:excisionase family DNA binding protein